MIIEITVDVYKLPDVMVIFLIHFIETLNDHTYFRAPSPHFVDIDRL